MTLEKAIIEVLEKPNKGKIEVMFNPKEYQVSTSAEVTGEGLNLQFQKVSIGDFTVTLLFDSYEKKGGDRDVRKMTQKITQLLMPSVEGKKTKRGPVCLFVWGGFSFKGIIHTLSHKFTMFLPEGIPVRAELTVTFKSVATPEEYAKSMGKEACRKIWTVKSGDRLDLIAQSTLKDVTRWRKIADENNIDNPLSFPKESDLGRRLIIPD